MPKQSTYTLLSLPEGLIEAVLGSVEQKERIIVLPLVCRTFRRLLSGPSASVWRDITWEADLTLPGGVQRADAFLSWLARHGSLSKSIQLDLWSGGLGAPVPFPATLPLGERLQATLRVCLRSCEFFKLRWGGPVLVVGDWVAGASALTCLALSGHEMTLRPDLAAVTTLQHLELSTLWDNGPELSPGCLPPSVTRLCCVPAPGVADEAELAPAVSTLPEQLLALPALAYLDVSESWFRGDTLAAALPCLTLLTSLALDKCELPDGLPSALGHLTRLQVLSFDGCIMLEGQDQADPPGAWSVLGGLTGLMSLSLSNCKLQQLPPAVASLPRMRHLYLEYNHLRRLPPGPYLRHLRVFSTDWEALLRSHRLLLSQAPHLRKLALGNMSICRQHPTVHPDSAALEPLSTSEELLSTLRAHTALREILLIVRSTHLHGAITPVLETILKLGSLRPDLLARPIENDTFFVEDAPDQDAISDDDEEPGTAAPAALTQSECSMPAAR